MSNFAFQVTGAFQGDGQFAFQGATGGVAPVIPPPPPVGNIDWLKKKRRKKRLVPVEVPRETIKIELPEPVNTFALQRVLSDMELAGFDIIETEDEDDALVLTFMLKALDDRRH